MRRNGLTVYATQSIETEYDLEFDDILELIDDLTESEKEELRNVLCEQVEDNKHETLYDDLKFRLMTAALKKYDLDELQKRLEIIHY
jgi:hypothetical protein